MQVRLEVSWSLGVDQPEKINPLLFDLLQEIDEQGSLTKAAQTTGVSYRNAWNLINNWSDRLGQLLVFKQRGKGASLSPFGKKLIWSKDYAQKQSEDLFRELADEVSQRLDKKSTDQDTDIGVVASHCLTHNILKRTFKEATDQQLYIKNAGSAKALTALSDGMCDVAGFHLVDGELRKHFVNQYRNCIDPRHYTLVHALNRNQGLIVAPGNPKNILGVKDFVRSDVNIINRQPHSGTRLLLDCYLKHHKINKSQIKGYDQEEFTHSAVSALVASNTVDVGMGTEASAAQFGLGFVVLVKESYFYAMQNTRINSDDGKKFIKTIKSRTFREQSNAIKGYDCKNSGELISAENVFL